MFERSTNPEVVARAVLLAERLADRLKRPPTDPTADRDKVRAAVAEERAKLAGVSGPALFEQIADMDRRRRIEHGSWILAVVNLERCSVAPGVGGEDWARGPVNKVASLFPARSTPGNRTRVLLERVPDIFADFPLLAIRTRSDHSRFRLDEGSERAVAYYLAGFKQAFAYVGRVPGNLNLAWKWEG